MPVPHRSPLLTGGNGGNRNFKQALLTLFAPVQTPPSLSRSLLLLQVVARLSRGNHLNGLDVRRHGHDTRHRACVGNELLNIRP
jgi:hypothetical protein